MENKKRYSICVVLVTLLFCNILTAQDFDILIKNGHVIDAKNNINKLMDIAIIDGKIASVETSIPGNRAKTVIDAKGLFVSPGLIDIHSHNCFGTEPNA